ncbi:DUF4384 domain-containing protein [bacterium]|nr:DUF4384 domain-containing protein [bacterium]
MNKLVYTGIIILLSLSKLLLSDPSEAQRADGVNKIERIVHDPQPPEIGRDLWVWIDKPEGATYRVGEEIAIYFRTEKSGYVVLYDIQPDGQIEILYPYDSWDNSYVYAGQTYRIPDHRDHYHLRVSGPSGRETIIAVLSPEPVYNYQHYRQQFQSLPHVERNAESLKRIIHEPADYDHYCSYDQVTFWVIEGGNSCPPYPYPSPYYGFGSLFINSYPLGATVLIDGNFYGVTPLALSLPAGKHKIRLKYRYLPEYRHKVNITKGCNTSLYANMIDN